MDGGAEEGKNLGHGDQEASFMKSPLSVEFWGFSLENKERAEMAQIKLLQKLFPVAPVTGPPGRVSGQKDLFSLGSDRIVHIKL